MPVDADKLQILWDERAITQVMLRFGQGLDLGDWRLYESCFTNAVNIDFKRLTGFEEVRISAALWTRFAREFQTPVRRHHSYSNFDIRLAGDAARAIVYFSARCWRSTDLGETHYVQFGHYDVRFRRLGDAWKISRLRHDYAWIEGNMGVIDAGNKGLAEAAALVFAPDNVAAARQHLASCAEDRDEPSSRDA